MMGTLQHFVPRNSRAQFQQLRMKQRGVLLVRTPAHQDDLAAARGIANGIALTAIAFLLLWLVL